jgi:hypothetical protein
MIQADISDIPDDPSEKISLVAVLDRRMVLQVDLQRLSYVCSGIRCLQDWQPRKKSRTYDEGILMHQLGVKLCLKGGTMLRPVALVAKWAGISPFGLLSMGLRVLRSGQVKRP